MKRIIIFVLGIAVVVGAGVVAWRVFFHAEAPTPSLNHPTAFPAAQSAEFHQTPTAVSTLEIPTTVDGVFVPVHDFRADPTTVIDPQNSSRFFLLNTASSTPFSIVYDSAGQFFTITLNREPLGPLRQAAAENFMRLLGIGVDDACLLPLSVETASGTNAFYAGKNLGFSFCPGAAALPQ